MPEPTITRKRRLRKHRITLDLSSAELGMLREKCAARGCSVAELLRRWINRRPRTHGRNKATQPTTDPRQLEIA